MVLQCRQLHIIGIVAAGTGFVSIPADFLTGGGFCLVVHKIMFQCGDFSISGIVAAGAGAGVVSLPADLRTGGGFRFVMHQVVTAVVLPSASGALSLRGAGRATVAAAVFGLSAVAAIADFEVHIHVANGLPPVPVVTENAVFRAAFFTDFSCDAGERSGAAGVFLTKLIMDFAVRAFIFYNDRMVL